MAITKADVTQVFNGQSDIILFNEPTGGYSTSTTFADIVATGVSLGQVVGDSTSWEGEDASSENIVDEQGDVIVANATAGTYGFSCEVASISPENLILFMKGTRVASPATQSTFTSVSDLVKIGSNLPVITRPIAIVNDEANKFILLPKAKIVSSFTLDSKLWRIKLNVTAETIDTTELSTVMLGKGAPSYSE